MQSKELRERVREKLADAVSLYEELECVLGAETRQREKYLAEDAQRWAKQRDDQEARIDVLVSETYTQAEEIFELRKKVKEYKIGMAIAYGLAVLSFIAFLCAPTLCKLGG